MLFVKTDEFSVSQKLLQGSVSQELTLYFSVFTSIDSMKGSKVHKSSNFESHSSLKLSFTIIRGFAVFVGHESFLESSSPDILALCEANFKNQLI